MKKLFFTIVFSFLMINQSFAADTDIYSVSTIGVTPNVLIIFDNSGSMSTKDVPGEIYDPNKDYSYTEGKTANNVYLYQNSNYKTLYFTDITNANWQCDSAKTDLTTLGHWTGYVQINTEGVATCGGDTLRTLRLGNFHNFDAQDLGDKKSRMEVAKKVIAQLIYDNHEKARFGLMKFNPLTPSSYYGSSSDKYYESGFIIAGCGASKTDLIGSFDPATTEFTDNNQSLDFGAIGGMYSDTYTPLAETMAEAGRYFAGTDSWFNGPPTGTGFPYGKFSETCASSENNCTNYSTVNPIQYRCQKNYIIFMTDGDPTLDGNSKLKNNNYLNGIKIPAAGKDGAANYLDDIAYFLAHNDLQKTGPNPTADELLRRGKAGDFENQTVTTYTIGFKQSAPLLQNAATNGGGAYYTADNASTLSEALNNIITLIYHYNEGFSAAAVPVSRANKAYAGNFVYYGLFQPVTSGNWVGNLKKYGITDLGVITDQNGNPAASDGSILSNAQSYWSPTIDGAAVKIGGAGEKLVTDLENGVFSRKIYTYTGTESLLTDTTNLFASGNTTILQQFNSQLTAETIAAIRHDSDNKWPLGSFLHSQPVVVHYDDHNDGNDDHSIIFAGANDGMLHCFDDNDGSEKWGYIPQDLLDKINTLPNATALQHYVDGSPELYTYNHGNDPLTKNKKLLIFGERRGGRHYTALDISNYNAPLMKYVVAPDILGGGTKVLGQSWGKPEAITIGYTHNSTYATKDVLLLPGGYDNNQDSTTPSATDDEGRAIFAVDAQTGALQTNLNFNGDTLSSMTHSIVAVAPFENPKSRTTTRIYAGDMNGNLFAFRDDIFHRNRDQSLKANFAGLYDGQEDGNWEQKLKLFSSPGKKIFYPPNILNVYFPVQFTYPASEVGESEDVVKTETRVGDYVFYGTGDREHPEDTSVLNEFYAIKNNWSWDGSTAPSIIKAYIDTTDGTIKDATNNQTLVARDSDGHLIITAGSQPFIIDVTADLYQTVTTDEETEKRYKQFTTEAINHPSNKGWYIRLTKEDGTLEGEKVVSTPIIYGGVVYFTTYVPDPGIDSSDDPCANPGAKGTGYLYAIGVRYGESVMNMDTSTTSNKLNRRDRRLRLTGLGIPPEPVLVIHEGKPTIVAGFETIDPHFSQSIEEFYWRQLYN